jgi:hypothetical protein
METKDEIPPDALGELVARHPALFHGATPDGSHLPQGWLSLADALCADLETIIGERCDQFEVKQVKEKWASLRFSWAVQNTEELRSIEIGGGRLAGQNPPLELAEPGVRRRVAQTHFGLRFTLSPDTPLANAIVDRIARAEEVSMVTCEWCGAPGRLWVAGHGGGGFHYTACDQHKGDGALTKDQWLARVAARLANVEIDDDLIRAVFEVAGRDADRARAWYDGPLPAFGGETPRKIISSGRKGDLLMYLASLLAGPAG